MEGVAGGGAAGAAGEAAGEAMPWWLRLYLLLGTAQGMALGITGLIAPAELQIPLRISPLNARVAAAMYTAAALGLLVVSFGRRAHARILVLCFALATTLILVVTLLHWSAFMNPTLPHRPLWLAAYVVDSLLALFVIPAAGFLRAPQPPARSPLRLLLVVAAIVLVLPGLVLLLAPGAAAAAWPWALPPVLAQVYGSFFIAFAVAGALASREAHPAPVRTVAVVFLTLAVLVLLASLLHLARFTSGPATWVWFGGFTVVAVAFGLPLLRDLVAILLRRREPAHWVAGRATAAPGPGSQ